MTRSTTCRRPGSTSTPALRLAPASVLAAVLAVIPTVGRADWGWPVSKPAEPPARKAAAAHAASTTAPTARHGCQAKGCDDGTPEGRIVAKLLRRMARAMGGQRAWRLTRGVSWDFFGMRHHWWDRDTDDARIESSDTTWLLNVDSRNGRVFRHGMELSGEDLAAALREGWTYWRDDGYWLFAPWKLCDEHVVLKWGGDTTLPPEGTPADLLWVTFDSENQAPAAKYALWISKSSHLVERWSYFKSAGDDFPTFTGPFSGWRWTQHARLAAYHGGKKDFRPQSFTELPRSAFDSPAPIRLPGQE